MKRALKRMKGTIYHYNEAGVRVEGPPPGVRGNLTGVRGDLTGVCGDLTGVSGDLTDVRGDIDDCELTPAEREAGVDIEGLIED